MTEDDNILAASYDWWSHDGSISPIDSSDTLRVGNVSPSTKMTVMGVFNPTTNIVFNLGNEPAMIIHPDGKITLGENMQPTEAAVACIEAMSHTIQSIIDRAVSEERAAIVDWLMREEEEHPFSDYSGFAAMIRKEIKAGVHMK